MNIDGARGFNWRVNCQSDLKNPITFLHMKRMTKNAMTANTAPMPRSNPSPANFPFPDRKGMMKLIAANMIA